MRRSCWMGAGSVLALAVAGPAPAQAVRSPSAPAGVAPSTEAPAPIQEVVVTARKRAERLFDVPGPISAVTPQQIDALHKEDARDLLTLIPNAFLQENNAGTARDISVRGVGTPNLFAEPGTALYVDEIYSSGFISYPTQFYDLERVEVLRGPQGALYGRNAVGGAVNVLSKLPTDRFEGSLRGSYESFDRYELQGIVNAPVTPDAAVRLFAWKTNQDSGEYYNQTTRQWIDANDSDGVRLSGRWKPTERLTLNLVAEYSEANTAGTNLYFPDAGETKTTIKRDTEPTNAYHTARVAFTGTYATPHWGDVTLVAGGRDYTLKGVEDTDLSADFAPAADNGFLGQEITRRRNHIESRFVEGRWLSPDFGPVNVLLGVTYLNEDAVGDIKTDLNYFSQAFGVPATLGIDNRQGLESWAGFAEATWKITSKLSLIGDLRYTSDTKTADFTFTPTGVAASFLGPSQTATLDKTFDRLTPGGTLAWTPTADLRLYGKVQTGFRAGGFNFNVAKASNLPYGQETSVNYEVGAKQRLWGGRAYVAATVFRLDQDNVLVPLYDLTAPGPLAGYLANAGEARTYGAELEGQLRPTHDLSITANFGWLDAELTSGKSLLGAPIKDKELPSSRPYTASITGSYRRPVADGVQVLADASYSFRARGYQDLSNTLKTSQADLINASVGLDFGRFDISVFVRNLLDDDYDIAFGGSRRLASGAYVYGVDRAEGRTGGVQVRATF